MNEEIEVVKTKKKKREKVYNVEPIRDIMKVNEVKNYILEKYGPREWFLFHLGINTGLRISDLLSLKNMDLLKDHIVIREEKTNKVRMAYLNPTLKKVCLDHIEGKNENAFVFKRRYGKEAITRQWAYMVFKEAGRACGLNDLATHTMRKTFGYHHYLRNKDVVTLMNIFNHSHESITLRYIGVQQDSIDQTLHDFNL